MPNVILSHLFVFKVGFLSLLSKKFLKIKNSDHFSNQLIRLIPKMQKFFEKLYLLKKFSQENPLWVTQPLKFFDQKSWLDVNIIVLEFQKNCSIRFKNCLCQYSNFEAQKRTLLAFAG